MSDAPKDEWEGWTDEALRDYENRLYDDEVNGSDVWFLRDKVLNEMNRRGLCECLTRQTRPT